MSTWTAMCTWCGAYFTTGRANPPLTCSPACRAARAAALDGGECANPALRPGECICPADHAPSA